MSSATAVHDYNYKMKVSNNKFVRFVYRIQCAGAFTISREAFCKMKLIIFWIL